MPNTFNTRFLLMDKQNLMFCCLLLVMLLSGLTMPAHAQLAIQSVKSLHAISHQFLEQQFSGQTNIQFQIGRMDPRLRLPKCQHQPEAWFTDESRTVGHTTISVSCTLPKKWKIHVPVVIRQYEPVLVVRRNLPRGHIMVKADLDTKRMDISRASQGFYKSEKQVIGLTLTRSLLRGQMLTPGLIGQPKLVKRGQTITIVARSGTLSIRVKGKAMMDGKKGDLIKVKNISTNRELRGIVVKAGVVQVSL